MHTLGGRPTHRTHASRRLALLVAMLLVAMVAAAPGATSQVSSSPDDPHGAGVPQEGSTQLLARPAPGSDEAFRAAVAAAGAREVDRIEALDVRVLAVPSGSATDALRSLASSPAVEFAERDHPVEALERLPNDPLYADQWSARQVRAPRAWDTATGDADVVVAVLDTGVDRSHEDLSRGVSSAGANFVTPTGTTDDDHGHGTLSAGVVAARTDNGRGVAGMCWRCTILPVKVLGSNGSGSTSDVASGIVYAADRGAEVINMSLGATQTSITLQAAVTHAEEQGSLLVASAGNRGTTERTYPAAYPSVVGVAAVDADQRRYTWSSYGAWVDVAAPGCTPSTDADPARRYSWYCGTSAAAPVVAGIAGLAFSLAEAPDHGEVRRALRSAAAPVGDIVAHGRVDAAGTLATLRARSGSGGSGPTPAPVAPPPDSALNEPDPRVAPEPDPDQEPGTTVTRWAGADRYETAARISAASFPDDVDTVYLATGQAFPDALAAGAAAASSDAPVLLTPRDGLVEPVSRELRRLSPDRVVLVGGTQAIAPQVDRQVRALTDASVQRVSGTDRYDTAAAIAGVAFTGDPETVFVATGETFPDALAGVPAAATVDAPLLLTPRSQVAAATRRALQDLDPSEIVVLGGEQAVSTEVFERLDGLAGAAAVRVAGADRYETATQIAQRAFPGTAATALLATGQHFPDALTGGPSAARRDAPILLTAPDQLPTPTDRALARLAPDTVGVLGGMLAVSKETAQQAANAASRGNPD